MRELLRMAYLHGVNVHVAEIDDEADLLGYYVPSERIIVLRLGMTRRQQRSVLAHELAHVILDHPHSSDAYERRADRLAAAMLVSIDEYLAAEIVDDSAHAIAEELDVTVEVVDHYRRYCLERIGETTYEMPRMGLGQWKGSASV